MVVRRSLKSEALISFMRVVRPSRSPSLSGSNHVIDVEEDNKGKISEEDM